MMPSPIKLSDAETRTLKRLCKRGYSWRKIGHALDISSTTARSKATCLGFDNSIKQPLKRDLAVALRQQGHTYKEIGSFIQCSDAAVSVHLALAKKETEIKSHRKLIKAVGM